MNESFLFRKSIGFNWSQNLYQNNDLVVSLEWFARVIFDFEISFILRQEKNCQAKNIIIKQYDKDKSCRWPYSECDSDLHHPLVNTDKAAENLRIKAESKGGSQFSVRKKDDIQNVAKTVSAGFWSVTPDQRPMPGAEKQSKDNTLSRRNICKRAYEVFRKFVQTNGKTTVENPTSLFGIGQFICAIAFAILLLTTTIRAEKLDGDQVKIDPVKTPIYFSKDVVLTCNITATEKLGNLHWYKLSATNVTDIAVNNSSRNLKKHEVEMFQSQSVKIYQLTIKKFAASDVNYTYRCDYGFSFDQKSLLLNEKEYIAMPTEDNIQTFQTITDNLLDITVMIEQVYPVPVCSVMFQEQNLTNKLKVTNEARSLFYKTTLQLKTTIASCKGDVEFSCNIGKEKLLINITFEECNLSGGRYYCWWTVSPRWYYSLAANVSALAFIGYFIKHLQFSKLGSEFHVVELAFIIIAPVWGSGISLAIICFLKRWIKKRNIANRRNRGLFNQKDRNATCTELQQLSK